MGAPGLSGGAWPRHLVRRHVSALTGTHWLAASACVCWFTYVADDVRRRDVLAAALYSHFLNIWWIVLVFCLYFSNANLEGI